MKITVIVPTYRRPQDLMRCLQALMKQTRLPEQVIVVVRDSDEQTWNFLDQFNPGILSLQTVGVTIPGVVAAMNAGLEAAWGDIIAFTDDDAEPHSNWLQRIESYYISDSRIGAVGGRDWVYENGKLLDEAKEVVGKLQWFGRVIGNHHLGVGEPREVDVLKGVNVSYRRDAVGKLRFDERMRGTGAQVHFELAFCLALKRAGWKMIYDPQIAVNHYPAVRFDEDQRYQFNKVAFANAVYNETLALLSHFNLSQRIVFFIWSIFIGTREALGLLQLMRLLPKEGNLAVKKWLTSINGRWEAWKVIFTS